MRNNVSTIAATALFSAIIGGVIATAAVSPVKSAMSAVRAQFAPDLAEPNMNVFHKIDTEPETKPYAFPLDEHKEIVCIATGNEVHHCTTRDAPDNY